MIEHGSKKVPTRQRLSETAFLCLERLWHHLEVITFLLEQVLKRHFLLVMFHRGERGASDDSTLLDVTNGRLRLFKTDLSGINAA